MVFLYWNDTKDSNQILYLEAKCQMYVAMAIFGNILANSGL